ncbi:MULTISPECIES: hypothetical protein [Calothrix]|uniref:Uncharacterized protein n=2 Tax=Calothrix TaxID=1186 RepID=A0ABR8AJN6_9CYAN|nr:MULTISPECIES: hypothetical protein [Calothrix]MBD2199478.1 hypothetical protein [Calothrix parietina FACHB-288]MBD2228142.1 hypothetical protein [Calothrix anomala FACHB-343]
MSKPCTIAHYFEANLQVTVECDRNCEVTLSPLIFREKEKFLGEFS